MSAPARDQILSRVRAATARLPAEPLPGAMPADRSLETTGASALVARFAKRLLANGGEVAELEDGAEFTAWLGAFLQALSAEDRWVAGTGVPADLLPDGEACVSEQALVGLSMARAAAARSATLVLDSRGDRRVQLLPSVHIVIVPRNSIHPDVESALSGLRDDLPAGLGLHSGPSKSADIGQALVTGVHGPGRLVAAIVRGRKEPE